MERGGGRMILLWGSLVLLLVFSRTGIADESGATARSAPAAIAAVTRVEGTPLRMGSDSQQLPVISGDRLGAGDRIHTDAGSRVELTFSDGGIIRTDGETTIELGGQAAVGEDKGQTAQVMLRQGRIWANFSRQSMGSPLQVLTPNALLKGAGGSVFYIAVLHDGGVEVKTYTGQVTAAGPFEIGLENLHYTLHAASGANQAAAPESWRHQIAAYRKLVILSSGEATSPFRFAAKPDLTDWVRWNQERDKE